MLVEALPRRVRKIKVRRQPTKCWTMPQLAKLLSTASGLRGCFTAYFETNYSLYRNLKPGSVKGLARTQRKFIEWLGRDPLINELSDEMLSRWVMYLEKTYAPKTAHNKRGDLLGVWRDAWEADKTGKVEMPKRIRRVKVPDPEPDSWSADEVAALVAAARAVPGIFRPEHRGWEITTRALYLEAR